MGGRSGSVIREAVRTIASKTAAQKAQISSGLGQVGETEEKAKKDKYKSNTISKKRSGTRGTTVPLQSTKTISGDGATKGVQI